MTGKSLLIAKKIVCSVSKELQSEVSSVQGLKQSLIMMLSLLLEDMVMWIIVINMILTANEWIQLNGLDVTSCLLIKSCIKY